MAMSTSRLSYFRAFFTVTLCYGLALVEDYFEGGAVFRVSSNVGPMPIIGWPMLYALWLMALVHLPLAAYYWISGIQVNSYFSNESVFKVMFTAWYGGVAVMGYAAMVAGMQYGWLLIVSMLVAGIGLARRGIRLRQIADYGSTCASLFVFYLASDEVPPKYYWLFYIGIGIVQCAMLALLEMVFDETFSTAEIQGSVAVSAASPASPTPPVSLPLTLQQEALNGNSANSSPTAAELPGDMSDGPLK